MKNQSFNNEDYLRDEYDFDFSKGTKGKYFNFVNSDYVKIEPDVQEVFKTSEEVNNSLRAIIQAMPKRSWKK